MDQTDIFKIIKSLLDLKAEWRYWSFGKHKIQRPSAYSQFYRKVNNKGDSIQVTLQTPLPRSKLWHQSLCVGCFQSWNLRTYFPLLGLTEANIIWIVRVSKPDNLHSWQISKGNYSPHKMLNMEINTAVGQQNKMGCITFRTALVFSSCAHTKSHTFLYKNDFNVILFTFIKVSRWLVWIASLRDCPSWVKIQKAALSPVISFQVFAALLT